MMGPRTTTTKAPDAPDEVQQVRVLVVDDSPFMRKAISRMLNADPALVVVGTAADGVECLERIKELDPDVITLDVVMPRMDGMTALRQIMAERPIPVVVLSSLTAGGAEVSLHALDLGAVDVVEKPAELTNMDVFKIGPELVGKVKAAAGVGREALERLSNPSDEVECDAPKEDGAPHIDRSPLGLVDCVVIGSSTGGPAALHRIISRVSADATVPLAIVQHMPDGFTSALAERLGRVARVDVKEASDGDMVEGGRVLIARAGMHMRFERRQGGVVVRLDKRPSDVPHMPSVDALMDSAAEVFGPRALGILLTGMGSDGAEGLLNMRKSGAHTIAEAQSSAVIYGMPRVAVEIGAAVEVLDLRDISARVCDATMPGDTSDASAKSVE